MSKAKILAELARLTPQDRDDVRKRLAELDQDEWLDDGTLTDADKALIEARFRDLAANPGASIPWPEAKARLLAPFRR